MKKNIKEIKNKYIFLRRINYNFLKIIFSLLKNEIEFCQQNTFSGYLKIKKKEPIFYVFWNCGFFSCVNTLIWSLMEFDIDLSNPITINNQYGMLFYKEENKSQALTWGEFFMQPSINDLNLLKKSKIKSKKRFDHHGNYYEILSNHFNFKWLKFFQKCYFSPSQKVRKIVDKWLRKYDIKNTNVLTILIRGTDKNTEVLPSGLEEYFNLVDKYIVKYKDARILIQTDQFQIRSKFIKRYKKRVFYIDEIPVTNGKIVMHELKLKDNKLNFGIKICAMIFTLSHTNYLITHTGNGGFFLAMLFYLKKKTFVQLR